jgi:hypothetical protein
VDINGKSRKYRRVEGFSHQLNIGDLPAGIYFLKVKGKNKSNAASRIFLVE